MKLSFLISFLIALWGSMIIILWRSSLKFPLGTLFVIGWALGFFNVIATIFLVDFYETRGERK